MSSPWSYPPPLPWITRTGTPLPSRLNSMFPGGDGKILLLPAIRAYARLVSTPNHSTMPTPITNVQKKSQNKEDMVDVYS